MRLRVDTVIVRQGETVGWGFGTSETDPGVVFVFGGDVRAMVGLGEAMALAGEPMEVDVPEWAIVDRMELPDR